MPSTVSLNLTRDKPGTWGFRLQGGLDFDKALTVAFVTEGTFSYNSGLRTGDVILNIGELEACLLTHKEAQDSIIKQGNSVNITVQRISDAPSAPQPGTWRPSVEVIGGPATVPAAPGQVYTKTSLLLDPKPLEEHWDVKHNITARGFQPGAAAGEVRSVAAPVGNPAGLQQGAAGPGFRSVNAPFSKPEGSAPPPAAGPPQPQPCWICGDPVTGVFLQVKGHPLHADCFSCATCSSSLKNVGHFTVGDKLYCQTHAREAQNALHGITEAQGPVGPQPGPAQGGAPRGLPQGLAQNLSRLAIKPQGQASSNGQAPQAPPAPPPTAATSPPPAQWANRLNSDAAGLASNAEDFTKEFMKQLTDGSAV